jgi:hypothetical protein
MQPSTSRAASLADMSKRALGEERARGLIHGVVGKRFLESLVAADRPEMESILGRTAWKWSRAVEGHTVSGSSGRLDKDSLSIVVEYLPSRAISGPGVLVAGPTGLR